MLLEVIHFLSLLAHLNAVLPFLLEAVLRLFHASKCSQAVASQMLQLLESEEFVYNRWVGLDVHF